MVNVDRRIAKTIIGITLMVASMLMVVACTSTASVTTKGATLQTQAQATLSHTPVGTSDLTWNATSQTLTVKIAMSGLAPSSTHPAHIHAGSCNSNGAIIYPLTPVVANNMGVGTSETTITGVKGGIPASSWSINVHNGPNLSSAIGSTPIACTNVTNPTLTPSTTSNQSVHLTFGGTSAPNESAHGTAQLSVANGKLTVEITMSGLASNSTHMAHVHKGSCEAQGPVLYSLNPVVADVSGKGTSTTVVPNVSAISASGWSVNVHQASTTDALSTQAGFNPIACGNIVAQ
jgi:hypothetical protein